MYFPPYQPPQRGFVLPAPVLPQYGAPPQASPPYEKLQVHLPLQEYKQGKAHPLIPFDPRLSNCGKFDSLVEAVQFIAKHCQRNHGYITKQIARKYLDICRIYDGPTGKYVIMNHIGKKEFDAAFNQVKQMSENEGLVKRKL